MSASLILPVIGSVPQRRLRRLLATTALVSLFVMPGSLGYAQVVIGDAPPPGVETYRPQIALPTRGEWPYNVKPSRKAVAKQVVVDPETLPSRQVSPKLLQAARLQQSGLTPDQVREAMTQPAPIMPAPELAGDKPDAPRDSASTLPPVATGPLMASLADNGIGDAPAPAADTAVADAPAATAVAAASKNVLIAPTPTSTPALPDSLAMVGDAAPAASAATAPAPIAMPQPATNSGRALFGGKRIQVADATPVAAPATGSLSSPTDAAASDTAAPAALDIDAAPTPPVAAPADTARNSTPAKIAPLTSLSAPPKLLARIGDNSRGAVQRPADAAVATTEPVPDAAPVAQVTSDSKPKPEPQPPVTEQTAAVLPAKPDEAPQAALVPLPQSSGSDDDTPPVQPAAVMALPAATATIAAAPTKPEHKTFWNRIFGSSEDRPEVKPAALPPEQPKSQLQPQSMADAAPAPIPAASSMSEPSPKPEPQPEPVAMTPAKAETPTPAQTTVDPMPEPAAEPIAAVETPAPALPPAKPTQPAPKKRRTLWTDLFGDAEPEPTKPAAATLPEMASAPMADEPFEPIPVAGLATPAVIDRPAQLAPAPTTAKSEKTAAAAETAALPKPEDRPADEPVPQAAVTLPVATAMPVTTPARIAADTAAPLTEAEPPTRYIEVPVTNTVPPEPMAMASIGMATPVAAPALPPVPAFRIETPAAPGATGLVTPRLVPVTSGSGQGLQSPLAATSAMSTISVPGSDGHSAPLAQVNFLRASQSVDSVGQAQLQAIAEAMQMAPQTRLLLNAYAKASNEPESRRISLNRALIVRTKLAELGIQPARIDVQALGEDTPSDIDGGRDRVDAILH